jgi:hypothetical protein
MPTHLTRIDICDLYQALDRARDLITEPRAAYNVAYLRRKLKPIVETINGLRDIPPSIKAIDTERVKICTMYAKKDAAGENLQTPTGQVDANGRMQFRIQIEESKSQEFQAAMAAHTEKYKESQDAWQIQQTEMQRVLLEPFTELDVDALPKIPLIAFKNVTATVLEPLLPVLLADDPMKPAPKPA